MRAISLALVGSLLASQGCVSFVYSRFKPERPAERSDEACSDRPPFADGILALLLGIGGLAVDGLSSGFSDLCGKSPNDPKCQAHVAPYVPAIIAVPALKSGPSPESAAPRQQGSQGGIASSVPGTGAGAREMPWYSLIMIHSSCTLESMSNPDLATEAQPALPIATGARSALPIAGEAQPALASKVLSGPLRRPEAHRPVIAPLTADTFKFQFTGTRALRDKLRQAQDLLRHRLPDGDLAAVIERAVDLLIQEVKKERFATGRKSRTEPRSHADGPSARHIPNSIKRAVFERDGGRCTFEDPRGRRCVARITSTRRRSCMDALS